VLNDKLIIKHLPKQLRELGGGCGVVSAWIVLRLFHKRVKSIDLIRQCRYTENDGVFMISLAVAIKQNGINVELYKDFDPNPDPLEIQGFLDAEKIGVKIFPAIPIFNASTFINEKKVVIALYDAEDGLAHISPISSINKNKVTLMYDLEDEVEINEFELRRSAPGICRQLIIVG